MKRAFVIAFLLGALATPVTFAIGAVAQGGDQDQSIKNSQQTQQERNRYQEQHRSWNGDYRYEETVDREWMNEQKLHEQQNRHQYRDWNTGFRYEETVDRNWLNEHNQNQ